MPPWLRRPQPLKKEKKEKKMNKRKLLTLDEILNEVTLDQNGIPLRLKMGNPLTRDPSLLL